MTREEVFEARRLIDQHDTLGKLLLLARASAKVSLQSGDISVGFFNEAGEDLIVHALAPVKARLAQLGIEP